MVLTAIMGGALSDTRKTVSAVSATGQAVHILMGTARTKSFSASTGYHNWLSPATIHRGNSARLTLWCRSFLKGDCHIIDGNYVLWRLNLMVILSTHVINLTRGYGMTVGLSRFRRANNLLEFRCNLREQKRKSGWRG